MKKILLVIMVTFLGVVLVGCSNNTNSNYKLLGNYELKEIKTTSNTYSADKLKSELGRSIKLEVTDKEFIKTTTYYATDGKTNDGIDKFTYKDDKLYDKETSDEAFYSYELKGKKLVITNLENQETETYTKK